MRSDAGISVGYAAIADADGSINTTSAWKTRFWNFVMPLFGASVPVDTGLTGSKMPGDNNHEQPMTFDASRVWFTAEGIPLTPYDDAGNKSYYPMMRLTART